MKTFKLLFLSINIIFLILTNYSIASPDKDIRTKGSITRTPSPTTVENRAGQVVQEKNQSNDIFWTSFGAALGGFLGASIWFFVRFLITKFRRDRIFIKSYSCANNINLGDNNEVDGELKHHHGKRIDNESELRRLGMKNAVWEWTRTPAGVGSGGSVIYGPYSTDFAESGKYSVIFRVRGMGFTQPQDITRDVPVLHLDVNRSIEQYMPVGGKIENLQAQNRFAVRYVRASELASSDWKDFELVFNCDGPGVWEYRIYAYDGVSLTPDNISQFGANVRIFFDKVAIFKINKMNISW
jgi:hypothetical protein